MPHRRSRTASPARTTTSRLTALTALTAFPAPPVLPMVLVLMVVAVAASSGAAVAAAPSRHWSTNLIANSGFEDNLDGWAALAGPLTVRRVRGGHDGHWSAALSDRSADTVVLKVTPYPVADTERGVTYHASTWVRAGRGVVDAVLRIREVNAGVLVGQHTRRLKLTDRRWHRLAFDYTTRSSRACLDYAVLARDLAAGAVLLVDGTWLANLDGAPPARPPRWTRASTPVTTGTPAPTPEPASMPSAPSAAGTGTLFGSSIYQNPGETFAAAYQRRVGTFGPLGIDRVFFPGLPSPWPGNAGYSGGPVIVSFKADPRQVLTGAYDAALALWFAAAPRGREIWWTYYHEPENQIAGGVFTAAEYRAAWQHIAALAGSVANPGLHATLILMCYTLQRASGRSFADYYPGPASIDTLGFDCYNTSYSSGAYVDPASQFAAVLALSALLGKPFGIAEIGSQLVAGDAGAGRAMWLKASAAYLDAHHARWVSYFDSPVTADYRLLDAPSQAAWRMVVTSV